MPNIPKYVLKLARDKKVSITRAAEIVKESAILNCFNDGADIRAALAEMDTGNDFLVRITDAEIERVIAKEQADIDFESDMDDDEWLDASMSGELGL